MRVSGALVAAGAFVALLATRTRGTTTGAVLAGAGARAVSTPTLGSAAELVAMDGANGVGGGCGPGVVMISHAAMAIGTPAAVPARAARSSLRRSPSRLAKRASLLGRMGGNGVVTPLTCGETVQAP